MADPSAASLPPSRRTLSGCSWLAIVLLLLISPVTVSYLIYRFDEFDAVPFPREVWSWSDTVSVPKHYDNVLKEMEKLGEGGSLPGPEDLVHDEELGAIYTGCSDGWIKRIVLTESPVVVENWVHVGGRPLGLAFGQDKELIVADALQGILKVTKGGLVEILSNEAEGLKFGLANAVDVAQNGVIYFTDTSYKYNITNFMHIAFEGRPYGRLISFDPLKNQTKVLARDLHFANGVAVSPLQDFVVFCELLLRRCRRYYIAGDKIGVVDNFVDRLPGFPDNIHYDEEGQLWIALTSGRTTFWTLLHKFPSLRKAFKILTRYIDFPNITKDGGVIVVNSNGEPMTLYSDAKLTKVSSGIRIENYLYCGSLTTPYIQKLSLAKFS